MAALLRTIEVEISPAGLLTIEAAAAYLGCSVTSMRFLRRTNRIPAAQLGKRLAFRREDLDAYISDQLKRR